MHCTCTLHYTGSLHYTCTLHYTFNGLAAHCACTTHSTLATHCANYTTLAHCTKLSLDLQRIVLARHNYPCTLCTILTTRLHIVQIVLHLQHIVHNPHYSCNTLHCKLHYTCTTLATYCANCTTLAHCTVPAIDLQGITLAIHLHYNCNELSALRSCLLHCLLHWQSVRHTICS